MDLDKALEFTVILAWQDFLKVALPNAVRVEYECESGISLDHLSIWLIRAKGYQDLVYEQWAEASSAHHGGARFANGHCSEQLTRALNFILKNQDQFTRADDCRKGRILVHPPAESELTEAAAWMRGLPGTRTNLEDVAEGSVLHPVAS